MFKSELEQAIEDLRQASSLRLQAHDIRKIDPELCKQLKKEAERLEAWANPIIKAANRGAFTD